jgi:hypothetical protein
MKKKINIVNKVVSVPKPVIKAISNSVIKEPILTFPNDNVVSVPKPVIKAISNFKNLEIPKKIEPILTFPIHSPNDNTFISNTGAQSFENLEIPTDKPEVIALTEFLPCYDINNNLTDAGQFFDAKQSAQLISAVDSIKNIINLTKQQKALEQIEDEITIKKMIEGTRQEVFNFCDSIEKNVTTLVASVEDTKNSLNFKIDFSENTSILKIPNDLKNISTISEITNVPEATWKNWSATKTWLQMCLEFREALQRGTSSDDALFVIDPEDSSLQNYKSNSYTIQDPVSRTNKLMFNDRQMYSRALFAGNSDLSNDDVFYSLKIALNNIFSTKQYSIFNQPMQNFLGETPELRSKNIARLSYIIAKELRYSSSLRRLAYSNSSVIGNYNYPTQQLSTFNNIIFWNYVIGKTGKDITEIPKNNYNASNLTGIAQSIVNAGKQIEILTFENSYINDTIQSDENVWRNAILTPGTRYYIESAIGDDANSMFNTSRVTLLNDSVKRAVDSLKDIFSDNDFDSQFLFSKLIKPRQKFDIVYASSANAPELSVLVASVFDENKKEENEKEENEKEKNELSYKNINQIIRNPIQLLRFIEKQLLSEKLTRYGEPSDVTKNNDISPILISFALENIEKTYNNDNLLTLLYMYVLSKVDTYIKTNQGAQINDSGVIKKIMGEIKDYFILYFSVNKGSNKGIRVDIAHRMADTVGGSPFTVLNRIAMLLASISLELMKADPDDADESYVANPFRLGGDITRSFYSSVQKESIMTLLFFLCCLMSKECNYETIVNLIDSNSTFLISKTRQPVVSVESFTETTTNTISPSDSSGGNKTFNNFEYDNVILDAESKIWNENLAIKKMASWFTCYLTILNNKLSTFINNIDTNGNFYQSAYVPIALLLDNDQKLSRQVLNIEQLNLIRNKLSYVKERLSTVYNSKLTTLVPYFTSLQEEDQRTLNNLLPIEDLHLASWNFLLKNYLKKPPFKEPYANNLKILSVGIPQKLYQRLQRPINAKTLQSSFDSHDIVSINVYLVDHLRPALIHKPQKFIFDLKKFPTRELNSYLKQKLPSSTPLTATPPLNTENQQPIYENEEPSYFPFFNLENNLQDTSNIFVENVNDIDREKLRYSNNLTTAQISQLIENHKNSLFLEEYLKFTTGASFDEHIFYLYKPKIKTINSSMLSMQNIANTNGSLDYLKNTLFLNTEEIKKSLIAPKKFDRVFHIAFDPDDFQIDIETTMHMSPVSTILPIYSIDPIEYYTKLGIIYKTKKKDKQSKGLDSLSQNSDDTTAEIYYQRSATANTETEFNSYYVELEVLA